MKEDGRSPAREKIRRLWEKYREIITYVIVGGMTTVVSLGIYYLYLFVFKVDYRASNVISWIFAVLFAFVANRKYVFRSDGKVFVELALFFGARLFSLAVEEGSLVLLVEVIGIGEGISKIIAQVVVLILNYVLSKLVVFRKKKKDPEQKSD